MIGEDKSCPGCYFNHPEDSLNLKLRQEVGSPEITKHGYICRKDVTRLDKIVDKFNTKFPRNTDQAKVQKPASERVADNYSSDQISARHIHPPSISNTMIYSTVPPDFIENAVLLMPNCADLTPTSNEYNGLYSSDSEDNPVLEEMVDSNLIIKIINKYIVVPPKLTLVNTPPKVLKKQREIRGRT